VYGELRGPALLVAVRARAVDGQANAAVEGGVGGDVLHARLAVLLG
jgi:hypothetical protein